MFPDASIFGYVARFQTLSAVCKFLPTVHGDEARAATAAYGMALAGRSHTHEARWDDMRLVLDCVARAKAKLDIASVHTLPVYRVTSEILLTVQEFAEQNRIAATEWPTADEVAAVTIATALRFAGVSRWPVSVYGPRGEVTGIRTLANDGSEILDE